MNDLEKFFRKISKKERKALLEIVSKLLVGDVKGFNIKKLEDSDFYRCKKGRFRIIFHYERSIVIIDSIRMRSENTYKDF